MSDHICKHCGCSMSVPDDLENTGFCNECAQAIAVAAEAFVEEHKPDYDEVKDSRSASNDATFLLLCEAVLPVEETM